MPPEPQAQLRQAIRAALAERSMTQGELGAQVGHLEGVDAFPQQSVAEWLSGRVRIGPTRIFAIERALKLPAGTLSKLEGYVPVGQLPAATVEEAIAADPDITDAQAPLLLAAVRAARESTRQAPRKRGR